MKLKASTIRSELNKKIQENKLKIQEEQRLANEQLEREKTSERKKMLEKCLCGYATCVVLVLRDLMTLDGSRVGVRVISTSEKDKARNKRIITLSSTQALR